MDNELLWVSEKPSGGLLEKNSLQITLENHMIMTTSEQIWSWFDYCKTKENVNIQLLDLCLFTFYSVHANGSTWHCDKQT